MLLYSAPMQKLGRVLFYVRGSELRSLDNVSGNDGAAFTFFGQILSIGNKQRAQHRDACSFHRKSEKCHK